MVTNAVLIITAVVPLPIELDIRYLLSGLLVSSVHTAVVHYRQSFFWRHGCVLENCSVDRSSIIPHVSHWVCLLVILPAPNYNYVSQNQGMLTKSVLNRNVLIFKQYSIIWCSVKWEMCVLRFIHLTKSSLWKAFPKFGPIKLLMAQHFLCRLSQEECARFQEGVPYVKVYRYNQKHLCPKWNGYGDNGQRKVWASCGSTHCTCRLTISSLSSLAVVSYDAISADAGHWTSLHKKCTAYAVQFKAGNLRLLCEWLAG